MAALRAKTMHNITRSSFEKRNASMVLNPNLSSPPGIKEVCQPGTTEMPKLLTPKKKPINAKGIAKMV
jgi:hypothetical protein